MQHYQRNTCGILKFCPTCNRKTMHRVDDCRVGSCVEEHITGMSKAQVKRAALKNNKEKQSGSLFQMTMREPA